MVKFQRAEIWTKYACNSGQRLAVVQHLLRCEGREALDGTDSVELDFPVTDAAAVVTTRQVVRLVFSDGSFTEWRVRAVRDQNGESGAVKTVTAFTPLQDMADAGAISELSLAGMPQFEIGLSKVSVTEVINTYVLPKLADAGYGYFTLGTVEPTTLYDVLLSKMSPLAALRYLCDLARDDETKAPAELRVRRNGTTGYLIDVLTRIGSTATTADIRYRKNLRKTELTTDSERQATVVQPFGAALPDGTPSGIARVAFRLTTLVGGTVYTIEDPEGGAAPSPVLFQDQLTGYFVVPDGGNPLVEIIDTAPPTGGLAATVQLASNTGITAGKVYELRADGDGTFLSEMASDTTITDRKVQAIERGDVLGVRNIVGNGWLRLWPDPDEPPTDTTYFPDTPGAAPYLSQNTDPLYTQYGGKSLRITDEDTTLGRVLGIRYPVFYPATQEGLSLHCFKVRVFFKRFAGAAWFYLTPRDGLTGAAVVDSEGREIQLILTAVDNPIQQGYVPTIGSWVDVSLINVDLLAYNTTGVILDVTVGAGYFGTTEGSVDCFIDAVQATQTVGDSPEGFVEYSGSNALWREGNRVLATFTDPPEHYEVDVDDLTRFDGTRFPFDQLTLGADVRLTDRSLAVNGELLRLVEKSLIDYLTPKRTQIKVASRWEQFVELAFPAGARPGVVPTIGIAPTPPTTPVDNDGRGGNSFYPMLAGPPVVVYTPPAEVRVFKAFKRSQHYRNTSKTQKARLQVDVWVPGPTGLELHLVKIDGFDAPVETGVFVRLDRENYPEPGAFLSLADVAMADNTRLGLATKNGDGTGRAAFNNVWFEGVTSEGPPDSPTGDPPGITTLFDWLFLSDLDIYADLALTFPQTANTNPVASWKNQVAGNTVNGISTNPMFRALLDTATTLNGYQSLSGTDPHTIFFDNLLTGTSEATVFWVTKKPVAIGHGSMWTLGGDVSQTSIYPDGDNVIKDAAFSGVRHVTDEPLVDITFPHIYAVRSRSGDWSNWHAADGFAPAKIYETATNTYQAGNTGDATLGQTANADGYTGWHWLFGGAVRYLSDAEMLVAFQAIADRYAMTFP